MAMSKFGSIWELISTYDFKDQISQELHCVICKMVTIDPYTSLCQCRFCSSCVTTYLKDGSKPCPGGKNDCLESNLEMNVNTTRDVSAIGRMVRIIVTCPYENCEVRCNLETMNDHLRVCDMSSVKCLYESMGCHIGQISKNNVKIHYENEWLIHTQLLVETIDNLKNEIDVLKNLMENKDEQINKFNIKSDENEMMLLEMKQQIDEQRNDIDLLKDKDERKENELEVMREDLKEKDNQNKAIMVEMENMQEDNNKMNNSIMEMKRKMDEQCTEIDVLKDKDGNIENEFKDMREYLKMNETQRSTMKGDLEKIKKDIVEMDVRGEVGDQNKSLNDFKEKQESIVREMASVNVKVRDCQIYDEREVLWRVDKLSEMGDRRRRRGVVLWRYSVKFSLSLWWSDGGGLYFWCNILKGEFDDCLSWPMEHKITLSVINQATMETHRRREYSRDSPGANKAAFDKPKDIGKGYNVCDGNDLISADIFMTTAEVRDSPGVILNDSLIVSFNIK